MATRRWSSSPISLMSTLIRLRSGRRNGWSVPRTPFETAAERAEKAGPSVKDRQAKIGQWHWSTIPDQVEDKLLGRCARRTHGPTIGATSAKR